MTIRRGLPPLLIAILLTGAAACSSEETPTAQLAAVTRSSVSEVVEAPATVGARAVATLTAPASGTVAKLYVEDGDTVEKGQILAKISSPQAEDQLDEARKAAKQASRPVSMAGAAAPAISVPPLKVPASLDRQVQRYFAKARKAAAKIEDPAVRGQLVSAIEAAETQHKAQQRALGQIVNGLNRSINRVLSQVSGQLGAGLSGLGSSMSSLQAASATQAKTAVKAAETTVKGLVIKAPFDGVVTLGGPAGSGGADLGGLVAQLPAGMAGQIGGSAPSTGRSAGTIAKGVPVSTGDSIATVTDVSKLTISADVDETDVLLVERGTPAVVEFDAVTGASYTAEVTGVGVTPKESSTGGVSYPVRLTLGKGAFDDGTRAPRPKPGMSAVVRLTVRESPDAVAVPASAIVSSGRDSVVWVARNGKAERQVVKLGAQGDATVEILRGLTIGDRVVVKGADTVRPGQPLS